MVPCLMSKRLACSFLQVLLTDNTHVSLGWSPFLCAVLPGRHPIALTPLPSWDLQQNPGFISQFHEMTAESLHVWTALVHSWCLTCYSIAAQRHHDQDNSYKRKHLTGACLQFRRFTPLSFMAGSREAWCWSSSQELYILVQRQQAGRETWPGVYF